MHWQVNVAIYKITSTKDSGANNHLHTFKDSIIIITTTIVNNTNTICYL